MRVVRSLSAAFIALALAGLASACQVALRAGDEDARCDSDDTVCGAGLTCQGGFCRPCTPSDEVCDGRDNNCNGLIDEGFDKDGDGYSTCGQAGSIDCNDDPASGGKDIHPGAKEICNGYDDNCNSITDEAPNDCGPDQECWSSKGVCTIKGDCRLHGCTTGGCNPSTGTCTDPDCRISKSCGAGETCDDKSGICVHITDIGEACDPATTKCNTGSSCIDMTSIGISSRTPSICTKACCESAGCPAGLVCRAGTSGASMCVKASDLSLDIGPSAPNTKCTSGGDCRSGVCNGTCQDGCCGGTTCGTNGSCTFKSDNKFVCRAPAGSVPYGSDCTGDSDCQSGFCYSTGFYGTCSKHCCSSFDCDNGSRCTAFIAGSQIVTACVPLTGSEVAGSKHGGEACANNNECRSARCSDGICTEFCCRDTDCVAGSICKPRAVSSGAMANACAKPGT